MRKRRKLLRAHTHDSACLSNPSTCHQNFAAAAARKYLLLLIQCKWGKLKRGGKPPLKKYAPNMETKSGARIQYEKSRCEQTGTGILLRKLLISFQAEQRCRL